MIVFASAYDEATRANHAVAERVRSEEDVFLGAEEATGENLHRALLEHDDPLFAMSHGLDDTIRAQGHDNMPPALATDGNSLSALKGRSVFAHACLTGRRLGRAASECGSVWWGYDVKVNAPEDDPLLLPVFVEVFSFVKCSFGTARSEEEVDQFFHELYERCEGALERLYAIEQDDGAEVPMGAHQCLIQIQQDLLVWTPGSDEPRFAPHQRGKRRLRL